MRNVSIDKPFVKWILISTIILYGLMNCFFLVTNIGLRRFITIQSKKEGGVVIIKNEKHTTPYILQQVRVGYTIDNPIDYLFLSTGTQQDCYACALLKLTITVLLSIFLWQFDFNSPFQEIYFERAKLIIILVMVTMILELIVSVYTNSWVSDHYNTNVINDPRYYYDDSASGYGIYLLMIILNTLLYLYGQAVKNQDEIELTI